MKLLTIGEFARAARLSPKALRLYDELGLLRPFRVDEWTGYRYYAPSQLERARLVAWLRRLGMPLAQIGAVVESPPIAGTATGQVTGSAQSPAVVPADLLNVLSEAVSAASASVRSIADSDPDLAGSGSTLTAMLLSGSRLALVHIGDSRAYLYRDGGLFQVTHDHTVTQSMIDAGRLTPEEAGSHPQRSLLIRAIGAEADLLREAGMPEARAAEATTPDLSLLDARPGGRYLLTSDGLTSVVPVAAIREVLAAAALSPEEIVTRLITLANEAGGPDNIALALADITEAA